MAKQLQLQIEKNEMSQIETLKEDLNEELDYIQPFKTPTLIYGKNINDNVLSLFCYTMGIQKNVFIGEYDIIEDNLVFTHICKYNNMKIINDILREKKIDGYMLLSDVSKNKMNCVNEFKIYNALKSKGDFGFMNYEILNTYIDLTLSHLNLTKTEDNIDEAIKIFCKNYMYGLYIYYVYHNGDISYLKSRFPDVYSDTINIKKNFTHTHTLSYTQPHTQFTLGNTQSIDEQSLISMVDALYKGQDFMIVNDKEVDIYLFISLNVSIANYKDVNLRGIKDKEVITDKIIDKIEKRKFLNKTYKTMPQCPTYDYCTDNHMHNELCNIYTNFNL